MHRTKTKLCYTTYYTIPSYVFPLTVESRRHLLGFPFSLQLQRDFPDSPTHAGLALPPVRCNFE